MANSLILTEKEFEELKNCFREEINSNRRFEQIKTVEELMGVLEDREALTDKVLLKCEPKFVNFVKTKRTNHTDVKKLIIPENVINLVSELFPNSWELLGVHLKLREDQLKRCQNARDVLFYYVENCEGISHKEMTFRLNRGLEKCGKSNMKNKIIEMMK